MLCCSSDIHLTAYSLSILSKRREQEERRARHEEEEERRREQEVSDIIMCLCHVVILYAC